MTALALLGQLTSGTRLPLPICSDAGTALALLGELTSGTPLHLPIWTHKN
jgi:hypothetical protein